MSDDEALPHLLALAERLAVFMESRDRADLQDVFADQDVLLIDSFYPFVFAGRDAARRWAEGFIEHARSIAGLRHDFGPPQEYSRRGDAAFLSLPVTWRGEVSGSSFHETGGLALVFIHTEGGWRVKNYGWAATSYGPATPT